MPINLISEEGFNIDVFEEDFDEIDKTGDDLPCYACGDVMF